MKKLRDFGIASIIMGSIIGCSTFSNFKNASSRFVSSINEKDLLKTRNIDEDIIDLSNAKDSTNNYKGQMLFIPNKMYTLKESLVGNYKLKALRSDSMRTRIVVMYFNHRDEIYQQALFAYDPKYHSMKANTVEIDWNCDGYRDMLLARHSVYSGDDAEDKLKLINRKQEPMIDYDKKNISSYVASTNDEK